MDSLMLFLNNPLIIMATQLGVGWVVKNKTATINKAIPLLNYVVGVLIQLPGMAFQQSAGVEPAMFVQAGFLGALGSIWSNPLFTSLIYTLLSTGTHSTAKNVMQMAKGPPAAA